MPTSDGGSGRLSKRPVARMEKAAESDEAARAYASFLTNRAVPMSVRLRRRWHPRGAGFRSPRPPTRSGSRLTAQPMTSSSSRSTPRDPPRVLGQPTAAAAAEP